MKCYFKAEMSVLNSKSVHQDFANTSTVNTLLYDDLPLGKWFRLLHLYPGQPEDPIRCFLSIHELATSPPFKALSYVWGDATDVTIIICNKHSKCISTSLFLALRRIRSMQHEITLWADAICINQRNETEKGHQVDLLSSIFKQAKEVIIWLGEDRDGFADLAFQTLSELDSLIQRAVMDVQNGGQQDLPGSSHIPHENLYVKAFAHVQDLALPFLAGRRKDCIKALYSLPYFTRVWVLQEVGLAIQPTVKWGDSKISFREIAVFIYYCAFITNFRLELGNSISDVILAAPYYALWNIWCTYGSSTWVQDTEPLRRLSVWINDICDVDFVLVLEASKRFQATNPLDHVYAFLGHPLALIPGSQEPILLADYSLGVRELNLLVASKLARQSLNFLVHIHPTEQQLSDHQFSTWIPQWNVEHGNAPTAFWGMWDASWRKKRLMNVEVSIVGKQLQVFALLLDTINDQTEVFNDSDLTRPNHYLTQFLESCWNIIPSTRSTCQRTYQDDLMTLVAVLSCHYGARPYGTLEELAIKLNDIYLECGLSLRGRTSEISREYKPSATAPWRKTYLVRVMHHYCTHRRFFITRGGYWALGPPIMRSGDICAIIFGADVPFILRPVDGLTQYKVVGECYIYGLMDGEAVSKWEDGSSGYRKSKITIL
ncbi:heterokaryon incompatibility protein-domain-containing protein [Xylariaceae sp. AK1471]|nr:heterokaryon incompatibility protein-domain-containing protein [Xylariaceae sp. AK1471]